MEKFCLPSKQGDTWRTPKDLYAQLNEEFHFDNFDPAPYPYEEGVDEDGLEIDWCPRTFVNPPFSDLSKWIRKAHQEWKRGRMVVMLMPARTDIAAFHDCILPAAQIRYFRGRIKFADETGRVSSRRRAPFPCMLAIWHVNNVSTD